MFSYLKEQKNVGYQNLVDAIRHKIDNGQLLPGDKLPTLAVFAEQTGLANYSVRKAIAVLVEDGLLETEQGGGVYVSENKKQIKIALADAFRFSDLGPQLRHPRTISGIYSAVNEGVTVDLLRPDTPFESPEAVMSQMKENGYEGLIWLYPEEDRMACIEALSKQIPIVVTSHSRIDLDLPTVESDENWNIRRVGKHFLNSHTPEVVHFLEPWVSSLTPGVHSGGHGGIITTLKYTLLEGGCSNYRTVHASDSVLKYRDTFLEVIENLADNTGVFVANTENFASVLEAEFERIATEFARLNVVIATSEDAYPHLAALAQRIDLMVSIHPLAKMGSAALQKITNILHGLNEDTTTVVRIDFEKYSESNTPAGLSQNVCTI